MGFLNLSNPNATDDRLPLTLLTGFLGAGKTTLLNRFLKSEGGQGTAVLVNEFGNVDVDGAVLGAALGTNQLMNLPNGCVCCEVQDDLAEALLDLTARRIDVGIIRCVIETTGLADPGSILRGVAHDPRLKGQVRVVQTICVASAASIIDQAETFVEAAEQIALADRIVISKADIAEANQTAGAKSDLTRRNPLAEISVAGPDKVDQVFANPIRSIEVPRTHAHKHTHGITTFSVELPGQMDRDKFRDILSFWIMRHAERLLRVKGILRFAQEPILQLMNVTHDVCSIEPLENATEASPLVFIGIDLPESEIRADLAGCMISPIKS